MANLGELDRECCLFKFETLVFLGNYWTQEALNSDDTDKSKDDFKNKNIHMSIFVLYAPIPYLNQAYGRLFCIYMYRHMCVCHRSGLISSHVKACCLTAPTHYLNWCRFIIKGVLWHSPESNFTKSTYEFNPLHVSGDYTFKITTTFPGVN